MKYEMIEVVISCPFCGKIHSVEVRLDDYIKWQEGELAQKALHYLTSTQREQLISGMCPDCQDDFFGVYPEGEDYDY